LVRVQASGNRPLVDRYEATIDVYLQAHLAAPIALNVTQFSNGGPISELFEGLHALVKRELSAYLIERLVESIKLND
jgi:hypothetical protein